MYKVIWCKVIVILFVIISLTRGETYCKMFNSTFADQDEIQRDVKKDNTHAYKFINLKIYETLKDDNLTKIYDFFKEDGLKKKQKQFIYSYSYYLNRFIYDGDSYVIDLDDFDPIFLNSDSSWFVNFYSHSRINCEICPFFAPVWKEVAKLLNGVVKIAAIDCKYNWEICRRLGIRAHPTLLYFQMDHSRPEVPWIHVNYTGKRTQEAIINFALNKLNINVPRIYQSQWKMLLNGSIFLKKPMLILICDNPLNCLTSNERLTIAATFNKLINVSWFMCESGNCHNKMSRNTYAIYLRTFIDASFWKPVFIDSSFGHKHIHTLIEKILDQLPNPQELSSNHFEHIRKTKSNGAWLIYFDIIDKRNFRDITLTLKKFLIETRAFNTSKINCLENQQLCSKLGVNRYPMWGMLKAGGAFELHYGKNTYNDTLKFALSSVKMTNVWALSAEEVSAILQRNNENEVWLLNWFLPWYSPCIQFLSDFRKASLEFDASTIRFGTVDCDVHATLCITQRFPTMTLINGSNMAHGEITSLEADVFTIIQFINEKRNSPVIKLTRKNFYKLRKKNNKVMWIVNYFTPWCKPCKKLAPHWKAVAISLSALSFVNVATVNCKTDAHLCGSQGIFSFPEIRLYPLESEDLSTAALYRNTQQNSLSILKWITTFFPNEVLNLNSLGFFKFQMLLLDDEYIRVVFFYLSHCWYSQTVGPKFAIAAQLLKEVKFGKVNCDMDDNHEYVCSHVKILPTIMLYKKKKQNKYDGIEIVANTAEAIRDEILKVIKTHDEINSRTKHDEL